MSRMIHTGAFNTHPAGSETVSQTPSMNAMVSDEIRTTIAAELTRIEQAYDCEVLLAVESGSRAWGFQSRDSDYDVRFVYVHRPEWYLSVDLDLRRDVIEKPITDELDISGWDIRKTLRLFAKSNPPLLEWLGSPIIYDESWDFAAQLRALLPEYYSPARSVYHYLHMAQGNYRDYLRGDEVWLKKYLYALRPLLAVRWLEQGRGVVPMEFVRLLDTIEDQPALTDDIRALVEQKTAGEELDRGPIIPSISSFIAKELVRYQNYKPPYTSLGNEFDSLNELFRRILQQAWCADDAA